jgi:hypothetical protein
MSDLFKSIYLVGLNAKPKNLHLLTSITNRRILLYYLGAKNDEYLLQDLVRELVYGPKR